MADSAGSPQLPTRGNGVVLRQVIFADFQMSADLPTGETVAIELLPKETGEFGFACPMGVFRGRLVVE